MEAILDSGRPEWLLRIGDRVRRGLAQNMAAVAMETMQSPPAAALVEKVLVTFDLRLCGGLPRRPQQQQKGANPGLRETLPQPSNRNTPLAPVPAHSFASTNVEGSCGSSAPPFSGAGQSKSL